MILAEVIQDTASKSLKLLFVFHWDTTVKVDKL